jgi:hypothetical protein
MLLLAALALGFAPVPPPKPGLAVVDDHVWRPVEVVTFRDFDDLDVRLGGRQCRAYLVGLRPLGSGDDTSRARVRKEAAAVLAKAGLSAQLVTKRGSAVGLSIDLFPHLGKPGPDQGWNPQRYGYCATGWGAYNLNLYFLHMRWTKYEDNFGELPSWRKVFEKAGGGGG